MALRVIYSFECGQYTYNFADKISANDTSLKMIVKYLCEIMYVRI